MKKEIFAGGAGFTAFSSVPLVADDVNAYEIVYTAPEDLSGTTFEITALRADGEKIVDSGEVSGSTARYLMKNSMHAVVGDLRVRLSVLDASGACLTTKELVFEVIEGNGTGDVTADTNYPILTELIVDMRKAISDSEAVLNDLQGEISDLHSYADGKADAALASAKSYADTKDGENLTAAKTYTDTKDAENLSAAKTYADKKLGENLEMTATVHMGDSGSLPDAAGGISRIKFYANGYPTIESGSPLSVSIYNGSAFLASVSAPVGFGGDDYLDCDAEGNVAVSWMRGNVQMQMLEADDFISKMAEADSVIINDSYAEMTYADVTYTATVSAKLDSEIERAKSAELETLENAKIYADTKAAAAEENAKTYGNQTFAGALKGEKLGGIVRLDDVSALDRRLDTVVSSKNIILFPYADGMSKTVNGVTFTVSDDGSITVNGTATENATFFLVGATPLHVIAGTTYAIKSVGDDAKYNETYWFSLNLYDSDGVYSAPKIAQNVDTTFYVQDNQRTIRYIGITVKSGYTANNIVIKPQIEEGTVSTAYTKHVSDLSGVSLKKFGKNLIPYPYAETTKTVKGLNFTDNGDGSVTVNGTATADATFYLKRTSDEALPRGTYFLSGCPRGGAVGTYNIQPRIDGVFDYTKYDVGSGSLIKAKTAIDALVISVKSGTVCNNLVFRPQLELGGVKTAFESPGAPTTYTVGADGTVQNLSANEGTTTLLTESDSVILKTKYSRDLNAAFTEIQNAIIALGGSF